jgi:hypothetical protein
MNQSRALRAARRELGKPVKLLAAWQGPEGVSVYVFETHTTVEGIRSREVRVAMYAGDQQVTGATIVTEWSS